LENLSQGFIPILGKNAQNSLSPGSMFYTKIENIHPQNSYVAFMRYSAYQERFINVT